MSRIRSSFTYANVMATIAVFIALGSTAGAASGLFTGKNIKNGSLTYKDLKANTLGGTRIQESSLRTVPRANALSSKAAAKLLDRCATGTAPVAGACVETGSRPALTWREAQLACAQHGSPRTPGRRLATISELIQVTSIQGTAPIAAGGELTADIVPTADNKVAAMTIDGNQTVGAAPDTFAGRRGFRCAYSPING